VYFVLLNDIILITKETKIFAAIQLPAGDKAGSFVAAIGC
jgi:hypothetical protein